MKVTDHNLGFPVNRTYEVSVSPAEGILSYEDFLKKILNDKTRQNVKVILHCTSEEKKNYSPAAIESAVKKNERVANVSVSYDVRKELHVRSEAITKAKTASEKLEEYLRVNKMEGNKEIYAAVTQLEDNLEISYAAPCHSFTLLWLKLRGSTGIKEGLDKDDYTLDLTRFSPGVIALSAVCGKGKSTLIENCQPWLRMLTRSGKLQDHFYLKDSCRELMYQDEEGTYYHITILIDGKTKSGKVRAFAETGKDPENLVPVTDCDGNLDPYEAWVNSTFGSIDLFLRTAFYTKGVTNGVPDISSATKGEKRTFFNSLMGTGKLSGISLAAREKAKEIKSDVSFLEASMSDVDYDDVINDAKDSIAYYTEALEKNKEDITSVSSQLNELKEKFAPAESLKNELELIKNDLIRKEKLRDDLADKRADIQKYMEIKDDYESYMKLKKQKESETNALSTVSLELREAEDNLKELELARSKILSEKNEAFLAYSRCEDSMPAEIEDVCPVCGQKLPRKKINELRGIVESKKNQLAVLKKNLDDVTEKYITSFDKVKSYEMSTVSGIRTKLDKCRNVIENIQDEMNAYDMDENEAAVLKAKAEAYMSLDIDGQTETLSKEIAALSVKHDGLRQKIEAVASEDMATKIAELTDLLEKLNEEQRKTLEHLGGVKKELDIAIKNKEEAELTAEKIYDMRHNQSMYEMIEKAFGANGIQALEMEALAPDVADITNKILHAAYGDKFKVSFRTLRVGSSGDLIEDFSIQVENTDTGTVKPLEWLSGGEGTWIKEALFHAFSVVRMRNTKFSFRTNFLDEADGALDHDSKLRYLKMIEKAHAESGVDKTILITHSQELKDVIEQRIEL